MNKLKLISIVGQWLAGIAGIAGLTAEIIYRANIWLILITFCSVVGYISTKVKHEYRKD